MSSKAKEGQLKHRSIKKARKQKVKHLKDKNNQHQRTKTCNNEEVRRATKSQHNVKKRDQQSGKKGVMHEVEQGRAIVNLRVAMISGQCFAFD